MTDEEIRKIVREECAQIIKDANLTDNDIIIKKDQLPSKHETDQHGLTSLDVLKKRDNVVIMIGKKGLRVISIVAVLWTVIRVGSMFVFEKQLPDAVDLAQRARQGLIEYASNTRKQEPDTPETWIVVSPFWKNFNDTQYKTKVHEYLTGEFPQEDLYAINTQFIPTSTSGMSIEDINSTSSDFRDFEV